MTESTTTRQIGLFIKETLKAYGIDNLQLEIDLFCGVKKVMASAEPVRTREALIAGLRKTLEIGVLAEDLRINMEARVKLSMGIDIAGRDRYRDMIDFLVKKDGEGQSVELFAEWCRNNPFSAPKPFQIAASPDALMINWPAAFVEYITKENSYPTLS